MSAFNGEDNGKHEATLLQISISIETFTNVATCLMVDGYLQKHEQFYFFFQ